MFLIPRPDIFLYYRSCLPLRTTFLFIAPSFSRFLVLSRAFYFQNRVFPHRAFHRQSHFLIIALSFSIVPSLHGFSCFPRSFHLQINFIPIVPSISKLSCLQSRHPSHWSFLHIALSLLIALCPPPSYLSFKGSMLTIALLGDFRHPHLMPPEDFTFESRTKSLREEDKRLFIEFAKRMLKWLPEERATARELYKDPWLSSP